MAPHSERESISMILICFGSIPAHLARNLTAPFIGMKQPSSVGMGKMIVMRQEMRQSRRSTGVRNSKSQATQWMVPKRTLPSTEPRTRILPPNADPVPLMKRVSLQ